MTTYNIAKEIRKEDYQYFKSSEELYLKGLICDLIKEVPVDELKQFFNYKVVKKMTKR